MARQLQSVVVVIVVVVAFAVVFVVAFVVVVFVVVVWCVLGACSGRQTGLSRAHELATLVATPLLSLVLPRRLSSPSSLSLHAFHPSLRRPLSSLTFVCSVCSVSSLFSLSASLQVASSLASERTRRAKEQCCLDHRNAVQEPTQDRGLNPKMRPRSDFSPRAPRPSLDNAPAYQWNAGGGQRQEYRPLW